MKKVLIKLIKFYQKLPFSCHNNCRFYPTCSNYMIECLERYGLFKGLWLGIKRIVRCNRFNKNVGIDLVPLIEEKRI